MFGFYESSGLSKRLLKGDFKTFDAAEQYVKITFGENILCYSRDHDAPLDSPAADMFMHGLLYCIEKQKS